MFSEFLYYTSIGTATTEAMTKYSSIGDNLEDVTISDLEIESMMRDPDSLIGNFMVIASHVKYNNKIGAEHLSKVWRVESLISERILGIANQRHTTIDNHSLERIYSSNDRVLSFKRLDDKFFMDAFFSANKANKSYIGNTYC